ncbi:type II toxin-antitoxin system Phd/YefM family antitoxin [Candidatus Woesebacteria bacterium]|nr:type II toxin-antitoxin system Phd/YefM family antitoxin [Candidatus Woesebacteria bacterium]
MDLISISDLRQKIADLVDRVSIGEEPFTIMKRSHPKAVLVGHDYFTSLEEAVLDLTDAKEAEKAKSEPKTPFVGYAKRRWSGK